MMLWPVILVATIVLLASWRIKGPLWVTAIAWLISVGPITAGWLIFATLNDPSYAYSLTLIGWIGVYVAGAATFYLVPHAAVAPSPPATGLPPLTIAWACWAIGLVGAGLITVDFILFGGAGLSDLQALRDVYVEKTSASIYAQIGSVMVWACLYSYIFALLYRHRLGRVRTLILVLPIAGYFLTSVFSAGRQAAFQMMLATVLTVAMASARSRVRATNAPSEPPPRLLIAGVSLAMISYMGYVAVARSNDNISDDKTTVLVILFDFKMSPGLEAFTLAIGPSLRAVVVESLTYFSSAIPLFQKYLTLDLPTSFGSFTFPFVMRQLQSLTGVFPGEMGATRIDSLNALGVVGTGWTTSFTAYMQDFGTVGAVVFLAAAGYYSCYAWRRALVSDHFEDIVIGILVLFFALYMPLSAAIADPNLFFLWLACLAIKAARTRPAVAPAAFAA